MDRRPWYAVTVCVVPATLFELQLTGKRFIAVSSSRRILQYAMRTFVRRTVAVAYVPIFRFRSLLGLTVKNHRLQGDYYLPIVNMTKTESFIDYQ